MAVNKILQVLIIDEFGGGEWFDVQSIDFEEEVVVIENIYGDVRMISWTRFGRI